MVLPMEPTQADLALALLHVEQLEIRASQLRGRIARIREQRLPTHAEEQELAALLRAIDILNTHLENVAAPALVKARKAFA
jgi:hypothetical protein